MVRIHSPHQKNIKPSILMNSFFEWDESEYEVMDSLDTEQEKINSAIRRGNRYILYWKIFLGVLGICALAFLIKCS